MAFDWKTFVDLSRQLHSQAPTAPNAEALVRSAVSRAYYGAYRHACNHARDFLGFEPRDDQDDHGRLRAHLKGKRRGGDSARLDRLRQWRNACDYLGDVGISDLPAATLVAIQDAERVFQSLAPPAPHLSNSANRVGGGLAAPVLPHHRTYSSYPAVPFTLAAAHTVERG